MAKIYEHQQEFMHKPIVPTTVLHPENLVAHMCLLLVDMLAMANIGIEPCSRILLENITGVNTNKFFGIATVF